MVTPYILKKLKGRELEEFLEHISHCGECYEELEIYFTVHYTLARLDQEEGQQVYNVKKAMKENLAESRRRVLRRKVSRICSAVLLALAELFLFIVLFTQIQFWQSGSMESNPIYGFINRSMQQEETAKDKNLKETDAYSSSNEEKQTNSNIPK